MAIKLLRYTLVFSLLTATGLAQADTMLEIDSQNKGQMGEVRVSVQDGQIRIDESSGQWMLYRADRDTLLIVDELEKEYTELDKASIKKLGEQMGAAREKLRQEMKNLSPEQRKMMEEMLGRPIDAEPPAANYSSTGERRTINGYDCNVSQLKRGGKVTEEFCLAQPAALGMSSAEYTTVRQMYALMGELSQASGFASGLPDVRELDGIPIQVVNMAGGQNQKIRRASHGQLSPEIFKIPAGYSKVQPGT